MRYGARALLALIVLALAFAVGACGKGDDEETAGESGAGTAGEIKTGPGVTDTTITLGILTDLSAVFAALAKPLTDAQRLYWDRRNADGGVCGRQVKLIVKDHAYDPQKATSLYRDVEPEIAAIQQLLGSPVAAALLPNIERDELYAGLAAWPSSLLGNPNVQITGATYDLEMINGIDYLLEEGKIAAGDKLGHIYFEGDFGESALLGSEYAAEQHDLTIVKQKIKATDQDMSAQIADFKREGVKAILISASPTQTASAAGVAKGAGLDVPILSNGPGFAPALLKSPVAATLKENLYVSSSIAPFTLEGEGVKEVVDAWSAEHANEPPSTVSVDFGWAMARVMEATLQKACDNKDLTRKGIVDALHQLSGLDTGGLVAGTLDYTKVGEPSGRAVYIGQPTGELAEGGIEVITDGPYESETAKGYVPSS